MRYNYLTLVGLSAFCFTLSSVYAEELIGNAENGAKKAPICAACHGQEGQGVPNLPNQPKLGAQHPSYIRAQLYELKRSMADRQKGLRFQNIMSPQASALTEQDMADVAAYFYAQEPTYNTPEDYAKELFAQAEAAKEKAIDDSAKAEEKAKAATEALALDKENKKLIADSKAATRAARSAKSAVTKANAAIKDVEQKLAEEKTLMLRGEQLYHGGDLAKHIPACSACHSPTGTGNGPAKYPRVAGQNFEYTFNQLHNFKDGNRKNDPARVMRDIVERMSDEEIKAAAVYIKYLKP